MEGVSMSSAKKLIETLKDEISSSNKRPPASYMKLVELFPLQHVVTKEQHRTALKLIEKLIFFVSSLKTQDLGIKVYLKTLSDLVADYEKEHYKSAATSGREMLAYLMDLQGLNQKDLAQELGGQPIVSKILNGDRELNIRQIKALAKKFKVSAEVFI